MTSKECITKTKDLLVEAYNHINMSIEKEQLRKSLVGYYGGERKPNMTLYLHSVRGMLEDQIMGLEYAIENIDKL